MIRTILISLLFVFITSYKPLTEIHYTPVNKIQEVDYVNKIQNNFNVVENDLEEVKDILNDPKKLKDIKRKIKRNK
jgi:hypothetical protein